LIDMIQPNLPSFGAGAVNAGTGLRPTTPAGTSRVGGRQASFSELLGRETSASRLLTREEKAQAAAEQFVSVAFVQPMLKQVRESSWAAAPFAPNSAEKQFRALQDASLAQQIVHSSKFPLVERVARDVLNATAGEKEGGARFDANRTQKTDR
jgi:Rod binding domain-containing protein